MLYVYYAFSEEHVVKIVESYMNKLYYNDWMELHYVPVWRLSIVQDDDDIIEVNDKFAVDYKEFGIFLSIFDTKASIHENDCYALCCYYLLRGLV